MSVSVPSLGRIVIYHHPGKGLVGGEPQDLPAMILEVSGGPISTVPGEDDTDLQTGEGPDTVGAADTPYEVTLEIFRPRGTEWKSRAREGEGIGGWSWPEYAATTRLSIGAVQAMIDGAIERLRVELAEATK